MYMHGPGRVAQLVRAISQYIDIAGSTSWSGHIQESTNGPGWCGSVGQSVNLWTKRLQVQSPIRAQMGGNWSMFLSHTDVSLPSFPSL